MALLYFILGILFIYIMSILDFVIQLISSYINVIISRNNKIINDMYAEQQDDDSPRIGFKYQEPVEYEYYEDESFD